MIIDHTKFHLQWAHTPNTDHQVNLVWKYQKTQLINDNELNSIPQTSRYEGIRPTLSSHQAQLEIIC